LRVADDAVVEEIWHSWVRCPLLDI
jgi:hypothetical protein